jgi:hypothetical protein
VNTPPRTEFGFSIQHDRCQSHGAEKKRLSNTGNWAYQNNCTIWTKYFRFNAYLRRGAQSNLPDQSAPEGLWPEPFVGWRRPFFSGLRFVGGAYIAFVAMCAITLGGPWEGRNQTAGLGGKCWQ